jgi:hypothetical protein
MIVSLVRPENAPSSDVFGHNRKRSCSHEDVGCHFDFGVADDVRGRCQRPDADQQSAADGATRELNSLLGDEIMLSVDQFLRLISLPAVVAAFLIASQVSGAGIF